MLAPLPEGDTLDDGDVDGLPALPNPEKSNVPIGAGMGCGWGSDEGGA